MNAPLCREGWKFKHHSIVALHNELWMMLVHLLNSDVQGELSSQTHTHHPIKPDTRGRAATDRQHFDSLKRYCAAYFSGTGKLPFRNAWSCMFKLCQQSKWDISTSLKFDDNQGVACRLRIIHHSLMRKLSAPGDGTFPKRKGSSSNHRFSGAMLVAERITVLNDESFSHQFFWGHPTTVF